MTIWELVAAIDGDNRAHPTEGNEPLEPMSEDEFDELIKLHEPIANMVMH